MHLFWRSVATSFLCWTALGMILYWELLVSDRDHAIFLPRSHYVVWTLSESCSWAILTPFIFVFARRYPFSREHWVRRVFQYAILTLGILAIRPLVSGAGWFYRPDQHATYWATVSHLAQKQVIGNLQLTGILFILSAYQNASREVRRRELREAELQAKISNTELQMLRMQLHPHFLFNTLQAATVLIAENPAGAERILQRLSRLLRVALDDMCTMQVPLKQELEFLENYVEIQSTRFDGRLNVRLSIDDETLLIPVPSLLLQPLVENAIDHGIGRHKGSDIVEVSAKRCGQNLRLQVINKAGDLAPQQELFDKGIGLRNTRSRLSQMYGDEASLQLSPLAPTGVCATVLIPIEANVC